MSKSDFGLSRREFGLAVASGVATIALPGVAHSACGQPEQREGSAEPTVVMAYRHGMSPGPLMSLEFALWDDGTMLFARNPCVRGGPLYAGTIARDERSRLSEAIDASGFLALDDSLHTAPDAGYRTILVRRGDAVHWQGWWEMLGPSLKGESPEFKRFLRAWKRTYGAIVAVVPDTVEAVDLAAGFRGYNSKEPWKTEWMRTPLKNKPAR